jgi:nucleotide-binding universal stress UspA family protein
MKILLAVDGSPFSEGAADSVARRPWPPGSEVKIVSVTEPFQPYLIEAYALPMNYWVEMEQSARRQAKQAVEMAAEKFNERQGVAISKEVLKGNPKSTIVDEAEKWGADLIIMGSHGYTGLRRMLLGSVSQAVASHAKCSVEIVRNHKAAA